LTSLRQTRRSVPQIVNSNEFGFLAKLKARLGLWEKFGNLFLGYCKRHKTYFLDYEHTNGDIRCPICDKKWLLKHRERAHALKETLSFEGKIIRR
jgi:DNA-directed RNA polymerase subunit RPC12/RpoP